MGQPFALALYISIVYITIYTGIYIYIKGRRSVARLALLLILVMSRGGTWLVEQPISSLLWRHFRLRNIARRLPASLITSNAMYSVRSMKTSSFKPASSVSH